MTSRLTNLCDRNKSNQSTGWRATLYYPNGSTYKGYWQSSNRHRFGELATKRGFAYNGNWRNDKRDGVGSVRQILPNGEEQRIYMGRWRDDMKCGPGKQFYANGVYHGYYKRNHRHGPGQMEYNDGSEYFGMWKCDVPHGIGVFFCGGFCALRIVLTNLALHCLTQPTANGNRYEGHFARGMKNGEGIFFHTHTGQIQKGMWENDICKTSLMMDEVLRQQGDQPTEYPIPKLGLDSPDDFIYDIFKKYIQNKRKPSRSVFEMICLSWVHKRKDFAIQQLFPVRQSKVPFDDVRYPCTCQKPEKLMVLRSQT